MLKWNPTEFKKKLISELAENGEIVGKFVENDARRRLLAIKDPEWGKGHRNYVSRLLTNVVETVHNAVVIKIGLPPGKTTKEGKPTRHLGFYIEMGDAHHAAHPYLRPAVFMNAAKILKLLSGK
jgi:hypothetical protein